MLKHTPRAAEAIAEDRARYEVHQRKGLNAAPQALPAPSPRPAPAPEGVIRAETLPGGWYYTCRLEQGQIDPQVSTVRKIANALEVPLEVLAQTLLTEVRR